MDHEQQLHGYVVPKHLLDLHILLLMDIHNILVFTNYCLSGGKCIQSLMLGCPRSTQIVFQCADFSGVCLERTQICDGVQDCMSGRDESAEVCSAGIPAFLQCMSYVPGPHELLLITDYTSLQVVLFSRF